MSTLSPLRPHQDQSLASLRHAVAHGQRRVMLQAPTGFGKTVVAAHIVAGALAKRKRITFCVPTLGLVDQTFDRFVENGIAASDIGVIQSNHPWKRPHAPVQIATAQTLTRRTLPLTDVVVIDEAHVRHDVYDRWMQDQGLLFIGLTATPWARGLGRQYGQLIKSIPLRDLTEQGYLAPCRVFAPSHPDLEGVRTVAGDYHEGDLAKRMNQPMLVADIVQTWIARGENRPTLCFATGRAHARSIHDQFAQFGIPVAYVDADTPREDRDEIGRKLAAGVVKVVCNIGTLTTGIDWDVRCLILARPTKSEILFVQIVGRALRTAPGKSDALILDHSDTHQRLGFVYDIDHDELDDGKPRKASERKKRETENLPGCCPSCAALMPPQSKICGTCGTAMPKRAPVESADGDLELFEGRGKGKKNTVAGSLAEQPKPAIYAQLLTIMLERGRSKGWLAHAYRDIYGVWPRGMDSVAPATVSPALRSFIRHKDIAFAKSKQREVAHVTA